VQTEIERLEKVVHQLRFGCYEREGE